MPSDSSQALEPFRSYLEVLARVHLDSRLRGKLDTRDIARKHCDRHGRLSLERLIAEHSAGKISTPLCEGTVLRLDFGAVVHERLILWRALGQMIQIRRPIKLGGRGFKTIVEA